MRPMEMSFGSSSTLATNVSSTNIKKSSRAATSLTTTTTAAPGQQRRSVLPMIQVIAPCDMDGGYTFMASVKTTTPPPPPSTPNTASEFADTNSSMMEADGSICSNQPMRVTVVSV
jgi:hypothetical protein